MNIGKEIVLVSRLLKRRVDRETIKHGLSANQGRILTYLYEHQDVEVYQRELEKIVHLRRSSITVLLQKLEKEGLITRENIDAKQKCLKISDKGLAKAEEILEVFKDNEIIIDEIVKDDKERMLKLLDSIKKELLMEEENG